MNLRVYDQNLAWYNFNDKLENSDSDKILIDEKSHEIILIYDTFHITL